MNRKWFRKKTKEALKSMEFGEGVLGEFVIVIIIKLHVCLSVCMCRKVQVSTEKRMIRFLGAGGTSGCWLPDVNPNCRSLNH